MAELRKKAGWVLPSHPARNLLILSALFLMCFFVSFIIGRYPVPFSQLVRILIHRIVPLEQSWSVQMELVVLHIRLPRILGAALVGASLAVSGAVYQGVFRNPLVSPDILGSSAGAGFGAALGILLSLGYAGISLSAFFFGFVPVLLASAIASRFKVNPGLGLILSGIMVGSLFSAMTSYVKLAADPADQLPAITYWLMGSLASLTLQDVMFLLPVTVCGLLPLFLFRWQLNVLCLGEEEAASMGIHTPFFRGLAICCTTLLTAASVSVSGMIGWIGLIIPYFARRIAGNDFAKLLPASFLLGASFLMIVDNAARSLSFREIPIGILTAFAGTPFFLYLLLRGGRKNPWA